MTGDWRNQNERSTPLMLRIIVWLAVHLRRRWVRSLLYPIVGYFMLTSARSRAASAQYLRHALAREPTWRDHWRHFFAFASCTLDRIFLLSGNHRTIHVSATWTRDIAPLVARGRGCLLVVAHFGSSEILRFTPSPVDIDKGSDRLPTDDGLLHASGFVESNISHVKTSILLDRQHGRMLMQLLESLNPEMSLDIIDAAERGPQLVLRLKEALEAGRMVCVMADRVTEGEGSVCIDFLGAPARMAETPWLLASALGAPVILGFGIYRGANRYESHFELFADRISLPRNQRRQAITASAQRYAARLEYYVRRAPYNWFNFYDYWPTAATPPTTAHDATAD